MHEARGKECRSEIPKDLEKDLEELGKGRVHKRVTGRQEKDGDIKVADRTADSLKEKVHCLEE